MVDDMKKRFRAKKKIRFINIFIFLLIMLITFCSFKIMKRLEPLFLLTEDYRMFTLDFDRNDMLMKNGFKLVEEVTTPVFNEVIKKEEEIKPRKKIYIYNTHQSEEYHEFNVLLAAQELKRLLSDFGIDAIVEETNITEEVKKHNYTYSQSYRITKELMGKHLDDNISLFIDLHRDSSNKNVTTANISGVDYAKLMFVVGAKHETYMDNYRVSDEINKMIKNNNASLSRGILLRKGSSYNQEVAPNVVLIELGGPYNTKDEVLNTLQILAKSIYEYLEE